MIKEAGHLSKGERLEAKNKNRVAPPGAPKKKR